VPAGGTAVLVVGMQGLAGKLDTTASCSQWVKQAVSLLRIDDGLHSQAVHALRTQRQFVVATQEDAIHNVCQKRIGDRSGAVVVQNADVLGTYEQSSGTGWCLLAQVQTNPLDQHRAIMQRRERQPVGLAHETGDKWVCRGAIQSLGTIKLNQA